MTKPSTSVPPPSQVVKLIVPIKVGGVEVDQLTIRRPKLREMKLASEKESPGEQEIYLITLLTEVAPNEIDELDGADYKHLSEIVQGFLAARPKQ